MKKSLLLASFAGISSARITRLRADLAHDSSSSIPWLGVSLAVGLLGFARKRRKK